MFLEERNRRRIQRVLDIDYAVLVGSLKRVRLVEKGDMGFFGGFLGAGYQTTEVSCDAIIIDMHTGERVVGLMGEAQGTSGGVGLGYGVFVFADEEGSIEHALAERIVETLSSHSQKAKVHITVFGLEGVDASARKRDKEWIYTDSSSSEDQRVTLDLVRHRKDFRLLHVRRFTIYRDNPGERDPIPVLSSYPQRPAWVGQAEFFGLRNRPTPSVFKLRSGRYFIQAEFNHFKSQQDTEGTRLIGWVDLEPGQYYVIRGRSRSFQTLAATWIENEATGEVVLGKKTFPDEGETEGSR